MKQKQVKKWIAFFASLNDGKLIIAGVGMRPILFDTKKDALKEAKCCDKFGAVVQITIPKGVKI